MHLEFRRVSDVNSEVLFAGPDRVLHLREDAARALFARTDGNAERVVLVSCDAAALARDVALLTSADYKLTSVTLVDLFAHTPHIECVTVLDR